MEGGSAVCTDRQPRMPRRQGLQHAVQQAAGWPSSVRLPSVRSSGGAPGGCRAGRPAQSSAPAPASALRRGNARRWARACEQQGRSQAAAAAVRSKRESDSGRAAAGAHLPRPSPSPAPRWRASGRCAASAGQRGGHRQGFSMALEALKEIPNRLASGQESPPAAPASSPQQAAPAPPPPHLQQACELQLVAGVLDLGEAAQLPERLHVPVPHLRAAQEGKA